MNLIKRPLITIAILIIAAFLNDYLFENVFFVGNKFGWISRLFCMIEIVFVSYCLTMVMGFKGLLYFIKTLFSKDKELADLEEAKQVSWPIYVASVLYGFFAGIIIYFSTDGCSFISCVLNATALSVLWGFVYRFFWKRGDLYWLLNWLYVDEHEANFEEEEEEKR